MTAAAHIDAHEPDLQAEIRAKLDARQRARGSLLSFVEYTFPRWQTGRHHRIICDALQDVAEGRCRRLMIFAPPRHSKTELSSRRFPAWFLGRWPRRQIICASYGDRLAHDIGADVRDIIRDPDLYKPVFPDVRLRADTSAAGRWRTEVFAEEKNRWETAGIYLAVGVGGPITGYGADVLLVDDPIKNRAQADSDRQREIIWKWYMGAAQTRLMPGGSIVVINTRWHEDDLCGRLLKIQGREEDGGEWRVIDLPAIANEHSEHETALWPEWFPLPELHKIRSTMELGGRLREWTAQYQGRPTPEEGDYIKRAWFSERYDSGCIPANSHIYMASDFAVTDAGAGGDPDFTEHGVFARAPDGRLYVVDWWFGQTTPDVWIASLLALVRQWKPLCWYGEGNMLRHTLGGMLADACRRENTYFRQEWLTSSAKKDVRGRAFQGLAQAGRIVLPDVAPWVEHVLEQCAAFPSGTHDDAFDVLSMICRAIDELHPAMVAPEMSEFAESPGDYAPFGGFKNSAWKTI